MDLDQNQLIGIAVGLVVVLVTVVVLLKPSQFPIFPFSTFD